MPGGALADTTASPPPEAPVLVCVGGTRPDPGLSHGDAPSGRLPLDVGPADGDEWHLAPDADLLSCGDAKDSGEQIDISYSKRLAIAAVSGIAARIPDSTIQGGRLSKPTGRAGGDGCGCERLDMEGQMKLYWW